MVDWAGLLQESIANLVGAFAGFSLALLGERVARRRQESQKRSEERSLYESARRAVLGSIVKNVGVARRLQRRLSDASDPFLLGVSMELSVWEASHNEILTLSPSMDEQVGFARFFDDASRIDKLIEFHRKLRADGAAEEALASTRTRLEELAVELHFAGRLLATDFGEDVHRRLLGIAGSTGAGAGSAEGEP